MSMTQTETIGFSSQVARFFEENKEALQALGLDVSDWGPDINAKRDFATGKNAEQDNLRAQVKVKTREVKAAYKDVYNTTSTKLDAAIGVLGKTTPLAKEAARLRSSVKNKEKKDTAKPK